jgi:hypothetical protein
VTDYGDYDPDDAYDTAAADPEQVARKLHALRLDVNLEPTVALWGELSDQQRQRRIAVVVRFLEWWRRQGLR